MTGGHKTWTPTPGAILIDWTDYKGCGNLIPGAILMIIIGSGWCMLHTPIAMHVYKSCRHSLDCDWIICM